MPLLLILSIVLFYSDSIAYQLNLIQLNSNSKTTIIPWYTKSNIHIGSNKREKIKLGLIDGKVDAQFLNKDTIISKQISKKNTQFDSKHANSIISTIVSSNDGNNKAINTGIDSNDVEIYNASVLQNGFAKDTDIKEALEWCLEKEVDIINISINLDGDSIPIQKAMKKLQDKEIPVIVASGNFPAIKKSKVITKNIFYIGSLDINKKKSNLNTLDSDFYFFGENILALNQKNKYGKFNGTSYACALATLSILKEIKSSNKTLKTHLVYSILKKEGIT